MSRKFFGLTLSGLAALGLLVIAPAAAPAQSVFKAGYTTQPPTLDAMNSTTTAARQVAMYLYETLVTVAEDYSPLPQLAESWEQSSDGLTYTFKVRSGVKFHNGKTLTAEDVAVSFRRFLEGPGGARMDFVKSIEATGPLTVVFKLEKKAPFIESIAMPIPFITVMPAEILTKYGQNEVKGEDVIGTGPTRLISWTPDVAIRLAKFEDYSVDNRYDGPSGMGGKRIVNFDEIRLIPATEQSARLAGLETGDFDFGESLPLNSYEDLQSNPNIQPAVVKPKWGIVLNINKANYPTSNKYFRQALAAALDREKVMQAITLGNKAFYRTTNSIYFPEQTTYYVGDRMPDHYYGPNQALVDELLKKAGYKGEEVVYMSNRDYDWMYKASLPLSQMWKAAGINLNLTYLDWPSEVQNMRAKEGWHMGQTGWSPRFDPVQFGSVLASSGDNQRSHWYDSQEMGRLLDKINSGIPTEERQKIWKDIQKLYWEDVPYLRVGDYFELEGVRSNVKGYKPWYVTPRFWGVTK